MKPDIHPEYSEVAFKDNSADKTFIIRTTLKPRETIVIDGKTYPLLNLDVSSASHPFYTGKQKVADIGGRIDKFRKRYAS
ncbi:type B 50S ribosomal protein L31 [Nevskia ramosa]|uniref:type B 50S ribosomal protein L31 n=1 Tax=Nevskia ramosa TaxID=64002 RepID=UPI0003B60243|nr:type B 50S ribosomal protein L31 [Nevskia ramosa]MDP3293630.1 type B 50S ribosomal protein L31 [Nevskia sp.]